MNPFKARRLNVDTDAIQATIQRALAKAGVDTATGPMRDVTETLRRVLGAARVDAQPPIDATRPVQEAPRSVGRVESHVFRNASGTRDYTVYEPASPSDAPRALVVMLHGCTQTADDFAAGTQMNRLADTHGFLVVYPEQATQANASRCWNWFQPQDQRRDAGEPSLIAGIVAEVVRRHGADPRRVFVAGLSAGAAMAVVLGETYPELFAGVGVHSGLPYGSAHDIPSALAAMKGGRSGLPGLQASTEAAQRPLRQAVQAVPTIVFHGDRDHTVQAINGAQIVQQAQAAHHRALGKSAAVGEVGLRVSTHDGVAVGGQRYSRTVHADALGQVRIESWTVHGAGHAWSGGHASGTFTDGRGPDASAEMVRFFLALAPLAADGSAGSP